MIALLYIGVFVWIVVAALFLLGMALEEPDTEYHVPRFLFFALWPMSFTILGLICAFYSAWWYLTVPAAKRKEFDEWKESRRR